MPLLVFLPLFGENLLLLSSCFAVVRIRTYDVGIFSYLVFVCPVLNGYFFCCCLFSLCCSDISLCRCQFFSPCNLSVFAVTTLPETVRILSFLPLFALFFLPVCFACRLPSLEGTLAALHVRIFVALASSVLCFPFPCCQLFCFSEICLYCLKRFSFRKLFVACL